MENEIDLLNSKLTIINKGRKSLTKRKKNLSDEFTTAVNLIEDMKLGKAIFDVNNVNKRFSSSNQDNKDLKDPKDDLSKSFFNSDSNPDLQKLSLPESLPNSINNFDIKEVTLSSEKNEKVKDNIIVANTESLSAVKIKKPRKPREKKKEKESIKMTCFETLYVPFLEKENLQESGKKLIDQEININEIEISNFKSEENNPIQPESKKKETLKEKDKVPRKPRKKPMKKEIIHAEEGGGLVVAADAKEGKSLEDKPKKPRSRKPKQDKKIEVDISKSQTKDNLKFTDFLMTNDVFKQSLDIENKQLMNFFLGQNQQQQFSNSLFTMMLNNLPYNDINSSLNNNFDNALLYNLSSQKENNDLVQMSSSKESNCFSNNFENNNIIAMNTMNNDYEYTSNNNLNPWNNTNINEFGKEELTMQFNDIYFAFPKKKPKKRESKKKKEDNILSNKYENAFSKDKFEELLNQSDKQIGNNKNIEHNNLNEMNDNEMNEIIITNPDKESEKEMTIEIQKETSEFVKEKKTRKRNRRILEISFLLPASSKRSTLKKVDNNNSSLNNLTNSTLVKEGNNDIDINKLLLNRLLMANINKNFNMLAPMNDSQNLILNQEQIMNMLNNLNQEQIMNMLNNLNNHGNKS